MGWHSGLLVVAFLTVVPFLTNILCEVTVQSTSFHFVGIIDKKLYYVIRTKQNWTQAKANCVDAGFEFATIRTPTELSYLEGEYKYGKFHGWHWIAARDSHAISQFSWDNGEAKIDIEPTLIADGTFNSTSTYLTCGAFQINDKSSGVLMVDCSKDNGYALCETVIE